MNQATEIVYDFIADDDEAMQVFESAMEAINMGVEGIDLGGIIREEFLALLIIDNPLMPLIRRMDEHVDWIAIGHRLAEATTAA